MKYLFFLFIFFLYSCNNSENKNLSKLKNNQAYIDIVIDGKDFYEEYNVFDSKISFTKENFRINLINQNNGNVIINLDKADWSKMEPKVFIKNGITEYSPTGQLELLVGKLKVGDGAEGYFFSNGTLKFEKFEKEMIVLAIEGNLIKPGDAEIKERFKSIKGKIIIKKPEVDTGGQSINNFLK